MESPQPAGASGNGAPPDVPQRPRSVAGAPEPPRGRGGSLGGLLFAAAVSIGVVIVAVALKTNGGSLSLSDGELNLDVNPPQ